MGAEMSHSSRAEHPGPSGWSRHARGDIAIFCVAVLFAVAVVFGATAARRPALVKVAIVGSVDLLTDPGILQELRAHGYDITVQGLGADEILARAPLPGYQLAYVPNQVVGQAIQRKLSNRHLQNDEVFPARSRLVVATYGKLARLLQKAGIARYVTQQGKPGIWMFDIKAYIDAVNNPKGALRWEGIPGNEHGEVFPNPGRVVLLTTDPRYSVLTVMFVAMASYALNSDSPVRNQAQVNTAARLLKPSFDQEGTTSPSGIPEWNYFLEDEINTYPMVLTYESLFVGAQETHDPHIKPGMVMMYTSPEMDVHESLIPFDSTGVTVCHILATDQRIQRIAESKLGFITTDADSFQNDMSRIGITVAGGIPTVGTPDYSILQDIVHSLP
jgi:hypothetical protein